MKKLKLKTIANKENCQGYITLDTANGLYYTTHTNDMCFTFQDLLEFGEEIIFVQKKIFIDNTNFVYLTAPKNLANTGEFSFEKALEDFKD